MKDCVQKATLAKYCQVLGNFADAAEGVSSRPSVTQTPMFLGLAHHFATQRADHVIEQLVDVRFWHKADIATALTDVRFWG